MRFALAALLWLCTTAVVAVAVPVAWTQTHVSQLIVGAAGWVGIELARHPLDDTLNNTTGGIRGIADVIVGQAESSLHGWLDITLAAAVGLVLLGVLVAGLRSLRKG